MDFFLAARLSFTFDVHIIVFDCVVLRTMLLFSRVDVTLHGGGCSVWADSGSTAIRRTER